MNHIHRRALVPLVVLTIATMAAFGAALLAWPAATEAQADPHAPCGSGVTGIEPDEAQNIATYDASPDIVTGVCIKSGTMFDGEHVLFTEDTADIENCYTITGIGTSTVTVERTGTPGPDCQGISHIDVLTGEPTPTPTPSPTTPSEETATPTPTPTPAALGETQGPTALPETGQAGGGGPSIALLLLSALGALSVLGGATAVAVAVRRRN